MTSYFWMFVQSLFLYLTHCYYNGLYNKVMSFTHKKITTFLTCWLTPALLVIIWVTIHKVEDVDHFDLTFKNVPGWTCIIGPIYLLLGISFFTMILIVYKYSQTRCKKLKNKCFKNNPPPEHCLKLSVHMIVLIMMSGVFGFVAVISIVINKINSDQHLNSIVNIINSACGFSQGIFVATIFAWIHVDKDIRYFTKKGISEIEAIIRQCASANEFKHSSQWPSVSPRSTAQVHKYLQPH